MVGRGAGTNTQISTSELTKDLIIPSKLLIKLRKEFNNFLSLLKQINQTLESCVLGKGYRTNLIQ